MNGPSTKHRTAIGWLEGIAIFGGSLVIVGLIVESGPEIWRALITRTWPGRGPVGSAIITVGVALEVGFGIFVTLDAKRAEREANERMVVAERATAEANLALAKIMERSGSRKWTPEIASELQAALSEEFAGMRIDLFIFDSNIPEVYMFGVGVFACFNRAGCNCKYWTPTGAASRVLGDSVSLAIAQDASREEADTFKRLQDVIVPILHKIPVRLSYSHGSFKKTDRVPPEAMRGFVEWDEDDVAAIRLQVVQQAIGGEDWARPVTPPQA